MSKLVFFWIILIQFIISFLITIFGLIGWVQIDGGFLKTLVAVLIVEQAGAVIILFKKTDFFDSIKEVNPEGWDLLATLWKYQVQCFPDSPNDRWAMAMNPKSPDFTDFAIGFSRLRPMGLIDINEQNQICLSTKGYQFCKHNEKKLNKQKRLFYLE